MERHERARRARLELRAAVDALKNEYGIERQHVAKMLGIRPEHLSRFTSEEVRDRPTLAPDEGWRDTLAPELLALARAIKSFANALSPPTDPSASVDNRRDPREQA